MGCKLRMCSRKYQGWKKRSPKKATLSKRTPKNAAPTKTTLRNVTPTKTTPRNATHTKTTPKNTTPTKRTPRNVTPTKRTPRNVTHTISSLHSILKLPQGWYDFPSIHLCKVTDTASSSAQPLVITHSIIVQSDFMWNVFVHNHERSVQPNTLLFETSVFFNLLYFSNQVEARKNHGW